jgi:hypothetical protein
MKQIPLGTCFIVVSCLSYSSNMKMEVTFSSSRSFNFQRTTQLCTPENRTVKMISYHHCLHNRSIVSHSCNFNKNKKKKKHNFYDDLLNFLVINYIVKFCVHLGTNKYDIPQNYLYFSVVFLFRSRFEFSLLKELFLFPT